MLSNYLKVAIRNLLRHPGYAVINVMGLAVGIACVLLILLFVRDELSYDRFHEHSDRIYRITSDWENFSVPSTNPPVVKRLKTDYPDLTIAHFTRSSGLVTHAERRFRETILYGGPEMFEVFTLPLEKGNPADALARPYTVVVTPETARRYFGEDDPIGRTLRVDNELELEVTGVLSPLPQNSHVEIELLASWATLDALYDYSNSMRWGNNSVYTYILLPEGYAPETLVSQFPAFIERHAGDSWNGAILGLQPLTSIHLHSHHNMELDANSHVAYVYVFSAIGLFILLLACVNFINLSTARAAERAREVGVRKVVGAHRRMLVQQYLSESVLMAFAGLVVGIGLVMLSLPAFQSLSGKAVGLNTLADGFTIASLIGITLVVGLVAGSYPAFVLASFRPAAVLKGSMEAGASGALLRRGLVIFQFATSVFLIIGTLVVYRQLEYLRDANLGFDQEQVVVVDAGESSITASFAAFRETLLMQPGVLGVSVASEGLPSELLNGSGTTLVAAPEDPGDQAVYVNTRLVSVGHDYFETLGTRMIHGRTYSRAHPADSSNLILNATAAEQLQALFPEQIPDMDALVGLELQVGSRRGELIGVVEDFNMSSLHEAVEPVAFFMDPGWYNTYLVRVAAGDVRDALAGLEATWSRMYPEWPIEYAFADEAFEAQYRAEERLGRILVSFTLLALFVACLGLFGLAAYTAGRRTKEIGVRKVLGASVADIVLLLSKEFVRLVLIAVVLASPLAFLAMQSWLRSFAYQIDMVRQVDLFVVAGLLALSIAVLTMSYQSVRAALTDPARALRSE